MTKRITIENAELTATFDGVAYIFPWVTQISIQDPRENVLSTSPQGKGDGVVYRTGTTLPVVADFIVREVPEELFDKLTEAFSSQDRVDFLLFDKSGGDQYTLEAGVIRTNPSNVDVAEGEDTFNVMMNVSCAGNRFKHKAPKDV